MLFKKEYMAFGLMMWFLLTGTILQAKTHLVIVDNTRSMAKSSNTPLADVYRKDIINILSKAGSNTFYFAPMGDPAGSKNENTSRLIGSDSTFSEISAEVGRLFDFSDNYSRINESLMELEGEKAFKDAETIVIISDMEPNHQIRGDPWMFNESEFKDLKKYLNRLDNWVKNKKKEIIIVLHGWERLPPEDEIKGLETFENELNQVIALVEMGDMRNGKKFVASGIVELRNRAKDMTNFFHIPSRGKDASSERKDFINILCDCLPVDDPAEKVCTKPVRTEFKILVEISKRLRLNHGQIDSLKTDLDGEIHAGPTRRVRLYDLARNISNEHSEEVDCHFRISAGPGEPFRKPRIRVSYLEKNGIVRRSDDIFPSQRLSSYRDMVMWLKNEINSFVLAYVENHFPINNKIKKIRIVDYKGAGIPDGYRFFAKWTTDRGEVKTSKTQATSLNENLVQLELPRLTSRISFFLKPGFNSSDKVETVELGELAYPDVQGRDDIHFRIGQNLFKETRFLSNRLDRTSFRLKIYMISQEHWSHKIYDEKKPPGDEMIEVALLPGEYGIYAEPLENDGLLQSFKKYIVRPEQLGGRFPTDFILHFSEDPLNIVEKSNWEKMVFGDDIEAPLTNSQKTLALESSRFLLALLKLSSDNLKNNGKSLVVFWKKLEDSYFEPSNRETINDILGRAMKKIGLVDEKGQLFTDAFIMLEGMFDIFVHGDSAWLRGNNRSAFDRRRRYNDWIDSITDFEPGDNIISKEMAEMLKYKNKKN